MSLLEHMSIYVWASCPTSHDLILQAQLLQCRAQLSSASRAAYAASWPEPPREAWERPQLHAQVVLNAGVWGGKAAAVHAVLADMVTEFDRLYSRMLAAGPLQVRNFDMAVLNTAALGAGARMWRIALGPPFCGGQVRPCLS